ncbi:MAG TPA: hypothetical protein VLL52_21185 [Anaerolineae bacterium]|nr:hypothetical protein [Anaerolineae bacterium]
MNHRPTVDPTDTPIKQAITYGVTAPNPHNTQAWKFELLSDTEMQVYIDPDRLLPVTDPPARQIHIGSGCFIETLAVGASAMGYETHVDYFPQGTYPFEEIGQKPVAKLSLTRRENMPKDILFDAIYTRQTNRRSYKGPMITADEIAQIRKWVGDSEADIFFLNTMSAMKPLLDIFYAAMELECVNRHTYEETRIWMRFNEKQRAQKRDGLSVPQTSGVANLMSRLTELFLANGNPKRWHNKMSINSYMSGFKKGLDTAKGLVYFKTDSNEQPVWIKTGRTYARFHLALTKLGFYTHVYSQVLQEFPEMAELYDKFHTHLGIQAPARIQMAVRIGRAEKAYIAPRREIDDYIIS